MVSFGSFSVVNDLSGNSISFSPNVAGGFGVGFSTGLYRLRPHGRSIRNQHLLTVTYENMVTGQDVVKSSLFGHNEASIWYFKNEHFPNKMKLKKIAIQANGISQKIDYSRNFDLEVDCGKRLTVALDKSAQDLITNSCTDYFTVTEPVAVTDQSEGMKLYYFGARYYDPELGIWLSVDPAEQFANAYAYAGNGANPVIMVDEDGNFIFTLGFLIGASVAVTAGGVSGGIYAHKTGQNILAGIGIGMGLGLVTAISGGAATAGIGAATASMTAAGGWSAIGAGALVGGAAGASAGFTGGFLNTLAFGGQDKFFSGEPREA